MKKVIMIIMALIIIAVPLTGCESKSKEELAVEEAREDLARAQKAADEANKNYYEFKSAVDDYKSSVDNYKSSVDDYNDSSDDY